MVTQRDKPPGGGDVAAELARLAQVWRVPCDARQTAEVVRYIDLLLAWSRRINLTAARSSELIVAEHLPDSFALASMLAGGDRLVDVGSGGGLPAIPLAVLMPGLRVTLVEPVAKKVAFLRTAVRELALGDRTVVVAGRAEELEGKAEFDAAAARAVWPPQEWALRGARLVRPGGRVFVLMTGEGSLAAPGGLRHAGERSYLGGARRLVCLERTA